MLNTKKKKQTTGEIPLSTAMTGKSFYHYLKNNDQKESTAQEHVKNIERFIMWAEQKNGVVSENNSSPLGRPGGALTYTELLEYVQYLKEKKLAVVTINIRLNSIRQYYEHLKEEGIIEKNPAIRLHIKGSIKKIITNPLSYTELEKLFYDFDKYQEEKPVLKKTQQQVRMRNKVMLSLMSNQALHSGELAKLRTEHVNLLQGILHVPSGTRSNSRELALTPSQVIPINDYLKSLAQSPPRWGGREGLLFAGNVHNHITTLINEVKGINPIIKNAEHIRASVILHWMKIFEKRKVQYMIGHRHISSTEHYEHQQLDTLTDQLERHHPFA